MSEMWPCTKTYDLRSARDDEDSSVRGAVLGPRFLEPSMLTGNLYRLAQCVLTRGTVWSLNSGT